MSNKRLSPLPAFETLAQDAVNQNQRTTISNTETPVEAVESMENIEDMEKTQTTLLSSPNFVNTEIDCHHKVELPQEVLRMICSHADPDELVNLRFVSKDFSLAAATHMFKEISFKFKDSSFKNLLNIFNSPNLQNHVFKLTCVLQYTSNDEREYIWSPQHTEYHLLHQYELVEALKRLPSLNAIRIDTEFHSSINSLFEDALVTNGSFDAFWSFLKSALGNVSNLTTIDLETSSLNFSNHDCERSLTTFSNKEMEVLGMLKDFHTSVNDFIIPHLPGILDCMQNLRSLSLGEHYEFEFEFMRSLLDFSELVNPSTIFPSLESLKLTHLYLNEQYFQEFLLNNSHSLRSLTLCNVRIEITKEELESKEYLKSNSWIRMFYFFHQSLHLEKIEICGTLLTSRSGYWYSNCDCVNAWIIDMPCRPSNMLLSLYSFITHVQGSSFPLPHPDEDLRYVDMREYRPFFQSINLQSGEIRLLEKEPFKHSTFKAFLPWTKSDSDDDDDREEEEEGEEEEGEEEEGEVPNELEDKSTRCAAFNYIMTEIRTNRHCWSDEEKESLINTLLEGITEENE
ncbi:hypothetical protein BOTCAL_0083g00020 [Botryotinia calthae]|uniref:F-box domain-containing protein n=1 Tax=Botryotinia calthae TaxID=38488 RepID=A0A4Y8D7V4_9HELO|nr:hypothetical protein BOTCAL_0083g00020 [Botryotinia calthae]